MEGKIILITGASSGIGAGTAQHFAKWHCRLVLVGRNTDALQETAYRCKEAGAQDVLVIGNKDLSDASVTRSVIDEAVAYYKGDADFFFVEK